jgi:two-component system phosphate regulon sensor histidine kinase PhoR
MIMQFAIAIFEILMKLDRTRIFIAVSSIALITVLIIQVNWIYQTAKIKEEIFNEKANMVLSKTAEVLSSDEQACRDLDDSAGGNEIQKTESLFTNYMEFYNLPVNYSFEVRQPDSVSEKAAFKNNVYKKRLEEDVSRNGLELNLFLPQKKQFILEEMRTMFITTIILIVIVLILFWRTILTLMKEKSIMEHTNDFLNNMTHEFKTPLTNIALAGKMISKEPIIRQEDKLKYYSSIILEENEKLKMQIEQVLSMTALERGEIPLHKTELDLHGLINECLKSVSIQIENKKGIINLKLNAANAKIFGDKSHLANAIYNLIDNSIKYAKSIPEITVVTKNVDKKIILIIEDKGIGIEKEYQKKVFDKFFRVPTGDVHDVKGFGLGLAYIKKIIELHHGKIELISEINKTTTFTITFQNA